MFYTGSVVLRPPLLWSVPRPPPNETSFDLREPRVLPRELSTHGVGKYVQLTLAFSSPLPPFSLRWIR